MALAKATVIPLSLKEPVGFMPSYFMYRFLAPNVLPRFLDLRRGVPPSPRLTFFFTGRALEYFQTDILTSLGNSSSLFGNFSFITICNKSLHFSQRNPTGSSSEIGFSQLHEMHWKYHSFFQDN